MTAAVWVVMMAVWLAALGFGAWWVWPHFTRGELTGDAVASVVWLVMGAAAWLVALQLGRRRFWPRR
jgi:hypothetical protein